MWWWRSQVVLKKNTWLERCKLYLIFSIPLLEYNSGQLEEASFFYICQSIKQETSWKDSAYVKQSHQLCRDANSLTFAFLWFMQIHFRIYLMFLQPCRSLFSVIKMALNRKLCHWTVGLLPWRLSSWRVLLVSWLWCQVTWPLLYSVIP